MGEYIFYRKKLVAARVKREEKCNQILSFFLENYGFWSAKTGIGSLAWVWHFLIGNISRKINGF